MKAVTMEEYRKAVIAVSESSATTYSDEWAYTFYWGGSPSNPVSESSKLNAWRERAKNGQKSSGNIYLRTVADEQYQKIPYQKDYWVKDPTGKSPITDLYGVPMVRKTKYDKKVVDSLKSNGVAVAESDLREEVKYMHSVYDTEKLEVDLNKWNFCLFDIEVASDAETRISIR